MQKGPLRILAVVLLAVTLFTLSGLPAAAASLFGAQTQSSCCDGSGDSHGSDSDGRCSTPDCPCFSCLTMIGTLPVRVSRISVMQPLQHVSPQHPHICDYVPPIEYPPENA